MGDPCPMVPGTTVQAKETSDGMVMTFTTTDDVAECGAGSASWPSHERQFVGKGGGMGMHGMPMGPDAGMGMMGGSMMGGGMMPAMHAQVEEDVKPRA